MHRAQLVSALSSFLLATAVCARGASSHLDVPTPARSSAVQTAPESASAPGASEAALPDAPGSPSVSSSRPETLTLSDSAGTLPDAPLPPQNPAASASQHGDPAPAPTGDLDKNGNPIPLERQQPKRILGFMPNFRSVSGGSVPPPPTFKNNFRIATRQAFDYSSFFFLGLTSISAEGLNEHPVLGKGVPGFWGYTWRGFLDKTDGTYLSAWLLPSILREDTRFYALGHGSILHRSLYVISRQVVAQTYSGRQTPNIAGLGGKVLTQVISRYYYPTGATSFGTLAEKFGYATMRDVAFTSIREFYPTIAAHYIKQHRAKAAGLAAHDAATAAAGQSTAPATSPAH